MADIKKVTNKKAATKVDARTKSSSGLMSRTVRTEAGTLKNPSKATLKLRKPNKQKVYKNQFSNPAMIKFPTDSLGITSGIKKEMIKAGYKIGTGKDTMKLLADTIAICMKHLEARYEESNNFKPLRSRGAAGEAQDAADDAQEELNLGDK
jgi:hypothetical protein